MFNIIDRHRGYILLGLHELCSTSSVVVSLTLLVSMAVSVRKDGSSKCLSSGEGA